MPSESSAAGTEPVVRMGDKIAIHCPECNHVGTHLGTCSWSQMRSGRAWAFYAEAVDIKVAPASTSPPAVSESSSAATCDGSSECAAVLHLHGCYSDDGTNCDHPSEHSDAATVSVRA